MWALRGHGPSPGRLSVVGGDVDCRLGLGWVVTSIERTAYPRFKRLITAHELHLFFSPTRHELEWAADRTDSDEHLVALLLMLRSYQRMGCFPKVEDIPEAVAEVVRRAVERLQ